MPTASTGLARFSGARLTTMSLTTPLGLFPMLTPIRAGITVVDRAKKSSKPLRSWWSAPNLSNVLAMARKATPVARPPNRPPLT